jgi:hypothetical protein
MKDNLLSQSIGHRWPELLLHDLAFRLYVQTLAAERKPSIAVLDTQLCVPNCHQAMQP